MHKSATTPTTVEPADRERCGVRERQGEPAPRKSLSCLARGESHRAAEPTAVDACEDWGPGDAVVTMGVSTSAAEPTAVDAADPPAAISTVVGEGAAAGEGLEELRYG